MYVCTDCVSGVCMCVSGEYMYNGGRAVNICTVCASGECMCRCASGECVYKRMRAG